MGILKSTFAPQELSSFSMRDVEHEAQHLLLRARRAADVLMSEARKEADNLKQQAAVEGHAEGRRQGISQGLEEGQASGHQAALTESKQELSRLIAMLSELTARFDASRLELESEGLTQVVSLAAAIARRVTKRQSQLDPGILGENLKEAMKLTVQAADIRVMIHPAQRTTLVEQLPQLQLQWPHLKHVELIDDESIEPGGCRVLTRNGEVDARIGVQLDRVINDLLPAT